MNEIFNLLFDMFGNFLDYLKIIPVWENVSLYDFSVAILILTILAVAFVPIVAIGGRDLGVRHEIYREPRKIGFVTDEDNDKYHLRRK